MTRREAIRGLGGALGSLALAPALSAGQAAACPALAGERIRLLVGWSPGGGYDTYARLLEPTFEQVLDAQVIVENLPGAAGLLAVRRLMAAAPDGRTLGVLNGTGLMLAPHLDLSVAPDLTADVTLLGRLAPHRQGLITSSGSGLASIQAVVALGRSRPLVMGVTGPTTVNTLLTALLEPLFDVRVELVAGYPGSREVMAAVIRGELDCAVLGIETPLQVDGVVPVLRFGRDDGIATWVESVPALSGPFSVATQSPELFRGETREVEALVSQLLNLMEVGRLVAAPPGLPPHLARCLREGVAAAMSDRGYLEASRRAQRSVGPASVDEIIESIEAAKPSLQRHAELMRTLIRRSQGSQ